ncbi:hypothetical protein GCM10011487_54250 [Steroidobacter agaridevorans]|uniref:AAA+ ATPase domain-containing protein n=1 Tax=Steroidobacter agaridevorans TaxID=2695856 RepID=A0A829YJG7_9GAMM|nr:TniB family NTP-binding protein [Steroidobacter agaridevorans]GFE83425.1 hypothetical protein GCM10011487_54250 [Steroidobacter agaridevorans]
MATFDHLDAETAELAERSVDERLASIVSYRFCNYPAADLLLDKLEVLFYNVAPGQQRGMAIFGPSGLGKSWLVKHFAVHTHPLFRTQQGVVVHPVVFVPLPPHFKDIRDLEEVVLNAMGAYRHGWGDDSPRALIQRLAKDMHVRMFIFDDIQHFLLQKRDFRRKLFDWLKYLLNESDITVVIAGLAEVAEYMDKEDQLRTRFETLMLPSWKVGPAFAQFVGNFERTFPLHRSSNLADQKMQRAILTTSRGITRVLVQQLMDASLFAIDQGLERIDDRLLNVSSTHPKVLLRARKRALVAYRKHTLGGTQALLLFPELERELLTLDDDSLSSQLNLNFLEGRDDAAQLSIH